MNSCLFGKKVYFYGLTKTALCNREIFRRYLNYDIAGYIDDFKNIETGYYLDTRVFTVRAFIEQCIADDALIIITSAKSFEILKNNLVHNSLDRMLMVNFGIEDSSMFRSLLATYGKCSHLRDDWFFEGNATIGLMSELGENMYVGDKVIVGNNFKASSNTRIEKSSTIGDFVTVGSAVTIGRNCELHSNCTMDNNTQIEDNVKIGEQSSIGRFSHLNRNTIVDTKVMIGKFCSIASGCVIGAGNHHIKSLSTHRAVFYDGSKGQYELTNGTVIGNDVWIGANCIIMDGITIGNGAIVGANSFVNKNLPAYSISFGTPAKVYSYRFEGEIINSLEDLKWWDIDDVETLKIPYDIGLAIDYLSIRLGKISNNQ